MEKNLISEDLRQLAKDTIDCLTDQERTEFLEWAKNEFPQYA